MQSTRHAILDRSLWLLSEIPISHQNEGDQSHHPTIRSQLPVRLPLLDYAVSLSEPSAFALS